MYVHMIQVIFFMLFFFGRVFSRQDLRALFVVVARQRNGLLTLHHNWELLFSSSFQMLLICK